MKTKSNLVLNDTFVLQTEQIIKNYSITEKLEIKQKAINEFISTFYKLFINDQDFISKGILDILDIQLSGSASRGTVLIEGNTHFDATLFDATITINSSISLNNLQLEIWRAQCLYLIRDKVIPLLVNYIFTQEHNKHESFLNMSNYIGSAKVKQSGEQSYILIPLSQNIVIKLVVIPKRIEVISNILNFSVFPVSKATPGYLCKLLECVYNNDVIYSSPLSIEAAKAATLFRHYNKKVLLNKISSTMCDALINHVIAQNSEAQYYEIFILLLLFIKNDIDFSKHNILRHPLDTLLGTGEYNDQVINPADIVEDENVKTLNIKKPNILFLNQLKYYNTKDQLENLKRIYPLVVTPTTAAFNLAWNIGYLDWEFIVAQTANSIEKIALDISSKVFYTKVLWIDYPFKSEVRIPLSLAFLSDIPISKCLNYIKLLGYNAGSLSCNNHIVPNFKQEVNISDYLQEVQTNTDYSHMDITELQTKRFADSFIALLSTSLNNIIRTATYTVAICKDEISLCIWFQIYSNILEQNISKWKKDIIKVYEDLWYEKEETTNFLSFASTNTHIQQNYLQNKKKSPSLKTYHECDISDINKQKSYETDDVIYTNESEIRKIMRFDLKYKKTSRSMQNILKYKTIFQKSYIKKYCFMSHVKNKAFKISQNKHIYNNHSSKFNKKKTFKLLFFADKMTKDNEDFILIDETLKQDRKDLCQEKSKVLTFKKRNITLSSDVNNIKMHWINGFDLAQDISTVLTQILSFPEHRFVTYTGSVGCSYISTPIKNKIDYHLLEFNNNKKYSSVPGIDSMELNLSLDNTNSIENINLNTSTPFINYSSDQSHEPNKNNFLHQNISRSLLNESEDKLKKCSNMEIDYDNIINSSNFRKWHISLDRVKKILLELKTITIQLSRIDAISLIPAFTEVKGKLVWYLCATTTSESKWKQYDNECGENLKAAVLLDIKRALREETAIYTAISSSVTESKDETIHQSDCILSYLDWDVDKIKFRIYIMNNERQIAERTHGKYCYTNVQDDINYKWPKLSKEISLINCNTSFQRYIYWHYTKPRVVSNFIALLKSSDTLLLAWIDLSNFLNTIPSELPKFSSRPYDDILILALQYIHNSYYDEAQKSNDKKKTYEYKLIGNLKKNDCNEIKVSSNGLNITNTVNLSEQLQFASDPGKHYKSLLYSYKYLNFFNVYNNSNIKNKKNVLIKGLSENNIYIQSSENLDLSDSIYNLTLNKKYEEKDIRDEKQNFISNIIKSKQNSLLCKKRRSNLILININNKYTSSKVLKSRKVGNKVQTKYDIQKLAIRFCENYELKDLTTNREHDIKSYYNWNYTMDWAKKLNSNVGITAKTKDQYILSFFCFISGLFTPWEHCPLITNPSSYNQCKISLEFFESFKKSEKGSPLFPFSHDLDWTGALLETVTGFNAMSLKFISQIMLMFILSSADFENVNTGDILRECGNLISTNSLEHASKYYISKIKTDYFITENQDDQMLNISTSSNPLTSCEIDTVKQSQILSNSIFCLKTYVKNKSLELNFRRYLLTTNSMGELKQLSEKQFFRFLSHLRLKYGSYITIITDYNNFNAWISFKKSVKGNIYSIEQNLPVNIFYRYYNGTKTSLSLVVLKNLLELYGRDIIEHVKYNITTDQLLEKIS